jgi:hypothetical protein
MRFRIQAEGKRVVSFTLPEELGGAFLHRYTLDGVKENEVCSVCSSVIEENDCLLCVACPIGKRIPVGPRRLLCLNNPILLGLERTFESGLDIDPTADGADESYAGLEEAFQELKKSISVIKE